MAQHYDVAVVGTQPAAVIAAALLAKRGRRVLLVDHGESATSYSRRGYRLPLVPRLVPQLDGSPPFHRVHDELGLGPELRAATRPLTPSFQAIMPRHRLDVVPEPTAFVSELAREFPREAKAAGTFLARLWDADDKLSDLLRAGSPIAPYGFGERWQSRSWWARASAFAEPFDARAWLAGIPESHPLHELLLSPLAFFGHVATERPSAFQAVRLLGRYFRGVLEFHDGLGGLPVFLLRAARQAGVEVREGATASRIAVHGRTLGRLDIEGDRQPVTADYFIAGTVEPFGELLPAEAQRSRFAVEEQAVRAAGSLLVLNLLVGHEVIPCGMAQALFVLNGRRMPRDGAPVDPPLLIQRYPAARVASGRGVDPGDDGPREVLSVACPVRTAEVAHSPDRVAALKEQILARVGRVVPFLREYLVDTSISTDTAGWDVEPDGARRVDPWRLHPLYESAKPALLGVSTRSPRTYFKNLWHCGRDVVPGLGIEGDYVTGGVTADGILQDAGRRWSRKP